MTFPTESQTTPKGAQQFPVMNDLSHPSFLDQDFPIV